MLFAVGLHRGLGVRLHLRGVVRVHARTQRGARLEPHVHHRSQHAGHAELAQGGARRGRLVGRLLRGGEVGRQGERRQVGERVELAALLHGEHPRRHAPRLAGDGGGLGRERAELGRVDVVVRREHDPAEVLAAQPSEDVRGEVGPAEAEHEQLGDLPLHRQPPGQLRNAARHGRATAAGSLRRRLDELGEERDPLLGRAAPRRRNAGRGIAVVVASRAHDHARDARGECQSGEQRDREPAPGRVQGRTAERYSAGAVSGPAIFRRHAEDQRS